VCWSPGTFRILGLEPHRTTPSLEALFCASGSADRLRLEGAVRRAIGRGIAFEHEYFITRPDGIVTHVRCLGDPGIGASGAVTEYLGAILDITPQSDSCDLTFDEHAELARLFRVNSLGALAASIAHEVSQPLAAVITNGKAGIQWLKCTKPQIAKARGSLLGIVRDAKRAGDVIDRVRVLARKGIQPERKPLEVNRVIRESIALLRPEIHARRALLRVHLAENLPEVLGDPVQLQQVVLNLVMNAVEAMRGVAGRPRSLLVSTQRKRDAVRAAIRDAGVGFETQTLERLFEPFYTTKPLGMGIGLALSRAIIEAHGGRLEAEQNESYGATFSFTLPSAQRS